MERGTWKTIGWVALFVATLVFCKTLVLLISVLEFEFSPKGLGMIGLAAAVAFTAQALLVLSVFALAVRLAKAARRLFGNSARLRLIALGITAFLFSETVLKLLQPVWRLLSELFWMRPLEAYRVDDDAVRAGAWIAEWNSLTFGRFLEALFNIASAFAEFSPTLFVAIAVWIVLGWGLSLIVGDRDHVENLEGRLRDIPAHAWSNFWLITVLVAGGFMSVAAISAIPMINEEIAIDPQRQAELESQIKGIANPENFASTLTLTLDAKDVLKRIDQELASEDPIFSEPILEQWRARLVGYESHLGQVADRARTQELPRLESSARRSVNSLRLIRLGARERLRLESAIRMALIEAVDDLRYEVRRCRRALNGWVGYFSEELAWAEVTEGEGVDPDVAPSAADYCEDQQVVFYSPIPRERDLGPFKFITALVALDSLPLISIVGMLGFGLLGSAISTFVRERAEGRQTAGQAALVADLSGVLLRGVSATFVVFLGVQGGLTLFGSGDAEPNIYTLLLTCFIGAVYSEDIWRAARDRLRRRLSSERAEANEEMTAEPAANAAGNADR